MLLQTVYKLKETRTKNYKTMKIDNYFSYSNIRMDIGSCTSYDVHGFDKIRCV